jgi:predicted RNase H-like HicB family nuclease
VTEHENGAYGEPESGRTDEGYPPLIEHSEYPRPGWVKIVGQDEAAPPGEFPRIRQVLGGTWPLHDGTLGYNLAITLWDKPPREYPPLHVGSTSAGQTLNAAEVEALRDALTAWLDAREKAETSRASRDSSVRFVADGSYWLAEDPTRPGCQHIGASPEAALAGLADALEHYDAVSQSAETEAVRDA